MKQGTKSILFGLHSPIHAVMVYISWIKLHKEIPNFMETCCIFLHDIGHYGLDYLDNLEEKRIHWKLGAKIAKKLFGQEGYDLIAGHDKYTGTEPSKLYKPDKYSWYIAPTIWLYWNSLVEPEVNMGKPIPVAVKEFQTLVKRNIESGTYDSNHNLYLERLKK